MIASITGNVGLSNLIFKRGVFEFVISVSTNDYNLATELSGVGVTGGNIQVIINNGVVIGSTSTAIPAFTTGTFDGGTSITLINNGRIQGKGGNGATGGNASGGTGGTGSPGGDALKLDIDLTVNNGSGEIFGAGGGAGGGGAGGGPNSSGGGGGGGGSGTQVGSGGAGGGNIGSGSESFAGDDGTADLGGSGGSGDGGGASSVGSGAGGTGGSPGVAGASGSNGNIGGGGGTGGSGGAAGNAVDQNGFTATFNSGGSSPNVEGSIA